MQPTTCSAILTEQMATLWRQADSECGTLFYQHHVILAVNQVLTNGGDLDMNLCFVTKLFNDLNLTFQRHIGNVARQEMLRADTEGHVCPDLYVGAVHRQPDLLAVW